MYRVLGYIGVFELSHLGDFSELDDAIECLSKFVEQESCGDDEYREYVLFNSRIEVI